MNRPDWDSFFMGIAEVVSLRSTCLSRKVGAVLVKDKQILATGYNGAPKGLPHCEEMGCPRENVPSGERHELCRGVHAEENTLLQSAKNGVSTKGAVLYTTTKPCSMCVKSLINAGVVEIVYRCDYPSEVVDSLVESSDVELRQMDEYMEVK